jgi:hypothetical protein
MYYMDSNTDMGYALDILNESSLLLDRFAQRMQGWLAFLESPSIPQHSELYIQKSVSDLRHNEEILTRIES